MAGERRQLERRDAHRSLKLLGPAFGGLVTRVLKRKYQRDLDRTTENALLALKLRPSEVGIENPVSPPRVVGSPLRRRG
jgi:hypothetical protein